MQTLTLSVFLTCLISFTHAISIFNVSNKTCEEDSELCRNDTTCNTIFQDFMVNCADLFNNTGNDTDPEFVYQEGRCPDECQTALDTYLQYLYPNELSIDYCVCDSDQCDINKQQLYDQQCIASDCTSLYNDCVNDVDCKPYADTYQEACGPLGFWSNVTWDNNYCPQGCADALDAYASYIQPDYTSLRFCDCNGQPSCESAKDILEENDCATPDCQDLHGDCISDPVCNTVANEYLAACGAVINGSHILAGHTWCPDDCKDKIQAYIDLISPGATTTDFCTCSTDACDEGKANLIEVGCVANDCTANWNECLDDVECEAVATAYLEACTDVLAGNWTENWCPTDCKDTLAAYIEIALTNITNENPLDYCDCNGHISCEEGRDRLLSATCFNVGCSKLHEVRCTTDECQLDWLEYITSCASMVNGSWTEAWCPIDCQQNLFTYLTYLVEPGQSVDDIDSICQCVDSNGICLAYIEEIESHGCITETCQSIWYDCQNDVECQPIADTYLQVCWSVINGSYTGDTCPDDCAGALAAYLGKALSVGALLSDEYCDCQNDTHCTEVLERFKEIDCVQQSCEYQYAVCAEDVDCAPYAEAQQFHCASVFNGSETSVCSTECRSGLQEYLNYMYPEVDQSQDEVGDYCSCDPNNTECSIVQERITAVGCIDDNDCWLRHYQCENDTVCAPKATAYLTACTDIIEGTHTGPDCPPACATGLQAYLDAIYGLVPGQNVDGYCNCNNLEQCTTVIGALTELDCLGLQTTEEPTTTETLETDTCATKPYLEATLTFNVCSDEQRDNAAIWADIKSCFCTKSGMQVGECSSTLSQLDREDIYTVTDCGNQEGTAFELHLQECDHDCTFLLSLVADIEGVTDFAQDILDCMSVTVTDLVFEKSIVTEDGDDCGVTTESPVGGSDASFYSLLCTCIVVIVSIIFSN